MTVGRSARRLLILLVSTALSLLFVDLVFRGYESRYWIHELPAESAVYDLVALNYNDHEGRLPAARGGDVLRVLVLGDSFAESATLPEWSYASRLQAILGEALGQPVRVVNLGRNGTSFADYLLQLKHWTARVDFDAVLIGLYVGNDWSEATDMLWLEDVRPSLALAVDESALTYGPGAEVPRRFPLRFVDYAYALYWGRAYQAQETSESERYHRRSLQYPADVYLDAQSRMVRFYQTGSMLDEVAGHLWLHRLLTAAHELELQGKSVAISVAPPHFAVDTATTELALARAEIQSNAIDVDLPAAMVNEIARQAGLRGPVVDLGPCLRAVSQRGEETYWGTNTHWSVLGNEVVARVLARAIAPEWLGVEAVPADPVLASCATTPRVASLEERRAVRRVIALERDWQTLEESALAGLADQRFDDPEALFSVLEARGFEPAGGRIVGAFWGHPGVRRIQIQRPHGLERFIRPRGFALDRDAPGVSLMIAFFYRGEMVGIGRTHGPLGKDAAHVDGVAADLPNVVFEALIPMLRPTPRSPDELWVLAVSPEGRYALLAPDENGPDDVSLPWARIPSAHE